MTDIETSLPDLLKQEIEEQKAVNTALFLKLVGVATILGDTLTHVNDDEIELHTCAAAAFMDIAASCPQVKITKTLDRYEIAIRSEDEAA